MLKDLNKIITTLNNVLIDRYKSIKLLSRYKCPNGMPLLLYPSDVSCAYATCHCNVHYYGNDGRTCSGLDRHVLVKLKARRLS